MDSVAPRDWRKAKPGTHTKEVRETRQELPVEFQTLIIATAEDLASLNLKMIDFERRLAEAEAEVEELKSLKSVTLNDLMKKSA